VAFPVISVKMPSSLAGQPNGKLPPSLLVKTGFPGRPLGQMHPLASQAWAALARDVKTNFNETLTVTSTNDAYRSYAMQEATFKTRYTTQRLPGRPTKTWNGVTYWQKPGTAMAATPGTSNHGWGLAADTCLYRNNAVVGITANMPMFNWMQLNAFRYGLSWEAQSEPWHLRYWSGDTVPPAVKPTPPTPTPSPKPPPLTGEDMAQLIKGDGSDTYWAWNGVTITGVPDLQWAQWGFEAGLYPSATPTVYPQYMIDLLVQNQQER
jgi:D-alanyl-D-alanine carboxypeptidase